MDVLQVEAIVAAVIALLTAAGFAARKLWGGARLAVRAADLIVGDGTPEHPGVDKRLRSVEYEVKTNGGGSVKDTTLRNEAGLIRVEAGLDRLEQVVAQVLTVVQGAAVTAEQAKERAAEAVDEAAKLAAALGRADAIGRKEREKAQASLDAVLDAFLDDRREQHTKTTAYIDALKALGIDLTDVTRELEDEPWDGLDRRR